TVASAPAISAATTAPVSSASVIPGRRRGSAGAKYEADSEHQSYQRTAFHSFSLNTILAGFPCGGKGRKGMYGRTRGMMKNARSHTGILHQKNCECPSKCS